MWSDARVACAGKYSYPTRSSAAKVSRRRAQHEELYRCPHCRGWHLATAGSQIPPSKPRPRERKVAAGARGLLFALTEEMA